MGKLKITGVLVVLLLLLSNGVNAQLKMLKLTNELYGQTETINQGKRVRLKTVFGTIMS